MLMSQVPGTLTTQTGSTTLAAAMPTPTHVAAETMCIAQAVTTFGEQQGADVVAMVAAAAAPHAAAAPAACALGRYASGDFAGVYFFSPLSAAQTHLAMTAMICEKLVTQLPWP